MIFKNFIVCKNCNVKLQAENIILGIDNGVLMRMCSNCGFKSEVKC